MESALDLEYLYTRYLEYHQNMYNYVIHLITVPIEVFLVSVITSHFSHNIFINLTLVILIALCSYYWVLSYKLGAITSLWFIPIYIGSYFFSFILYSTAISTILFIITFICQVLSYNFLEGSSPSFYKVPVLGPMFFTLEISDLIGRFFPNKQITTTTTVLFN